MDIINIKVYYKNNLLGSEKIKKGTTLLEIKEKFKEKFKEKVQSEIILARINNENLELSYEVINDCNIEILDISDKHAYLTYKRSVMLMFINAVRKVMGKDKRITLKYSINQNWVCEMDSVMITDENVIDIENYMKDIVKNNLPISKLTVPINKSIDFFNENKMYDRAVGLKYVRKSTIRLYKLENTYDYLYGTMAAESKGLGGFKLTKSSDGLFVLNFLDKMDITKYSEFKDIKKLRDVFIESSKWAKIVGIDSAGALNEAICKEKIREKILVSEGLQEKKIAQIADEISKKNKKVVLIAGPSSSGKTTFANRICIQLKVNGLVPHIISLDNYYLERSKVPLDENGNPDFECIESLDVERINQDIKGLINGEIVEIPKFNFISGKREKGQSIRLSENEVIIIEGIHGLNEKISAEIERKDKYKIFISALTQLNIDTHNRISTTDARILRRMIRDHYFRGFGVSKTIKMWADVTKGEAKHIFPFQDEADIIFNSSLIYELAVLKLFAEPLLYSVSNNEPEYAEATRLIKFLDSFLTVTDISSIPPNSIIREFIGGSCF